MPVSSKPRKKKRNNKNGSRKQRLTNRNRPAMSKEEKAFERLPPGLKRTYQMMIDKGIKGNPKDYVIIFGNTLLDGERETKVTIEDMVQAFPDFPTLLHKKKLIQWVGDEVAALFWYPTLNKRIPRTVSMKLLAQRSERNLTRIADKLKKEKEND